MLGSGPGAVPWGHGTHGTHGTCPKSTIGKIIIEMVESPEPFEKMTRMLQILFDRSTLGGAVDYARIF